jgi:hypothetical protein
MYATTAAEAIFASPLQPSDVVTDAEVAAAVQHSLELFGELGCACTLAAEYGEHPDVARARMRWALSVTSALAA